MDQKFISFYVKKQQAGMSDDDIIADAAQSKTYGPVIQAAKEKGLEARDILIGLGNGDLQQAMGKTLPERPFMAGVGRGMEDVAAGAAELLPDAIEPTKFLNRSQARADTYDEANPNIGFDGGRMLGQAAALAPLALAGPGAAASTGTRIAANAALGATAGYIPRAKDNSERLGNAMVGAAAGAVVPEAVRAGVGQAVKGVNRVKAMIGKPRSARW